MLKTLPLICLALCLWGCTPADPATAICIEAASEYPAIYLPMVQIDGETPAGEVPYISLSTKTNAVAAHLNIYDPERFARDNGKVKIWLVNYERTDSLFLMSETIRIDKYLHIYTSVGKDSIGGIYPMFERAEEKKLYWESIQDTVWLYSLWRDY